MTAKPPSKMRFTSGETSAPRYVAVFSGLALTARKMKCRPSGRNCGKEWPVSCRDWSSVVKGFGSPPAALTLYSGWFGCGTRIKLLRFHATESKPDCRLQMVCAVPPLMLTFLRPDDVLNAISSLPGDQESPYAPSVPGTGFVTMEFRE